MEVSFIKDDKAPKQLTFGDVEVERFFVDTHGRLFVKVDASTAFQIATREGAIRTGEGEWRGDSDIERILDVTRIKF